MTRKILRRCDVCGRFHAAYLVPAEAGQPRYYCYDCWKARFDTSPPQTTGMANESPNSSNLDNKPL